MALPPADYFTDPTRTNGEAKQAQDDMLDALLALPDTFGDVTGPSSSTANAIALFDGIGGKTIKDSGYTITAAGAALLDDADAAAQRATLGLGTAAVSTLGIADSQVPTGADLIVNRTAETSPAADDMILIFDTSASALRKMSRSNFLSGMGDHFSSDYMCVTDTKTSGTAGGTFSSGSWQTRTINTVIENHIVGASLSSNRITLPIGSYHIDASAVAFSVDRNRLRVQDITGGTTLAVGNSELSSSSSSVAVSCRVVGRFTLSTSSQIELQHICQSTKTTNGYGEPGSFYSEVYANVMIWKIS